MTILYKYYSSSLDLEKYIINPTIRLTQTTGLNDPFEGKVSDKIMKVLCERIILIEDFPTFDTEEETLSRLHEILEEGMKSLSVVALTETQRNLLMWSHYASEHRGCCIGYEADIFEGLETRNKEICYSYTPIKVNYDSVVFDDDQFNSLDNKKALTDDELNETIKRAITTKSDAWIYEKEHRLVVPVEWSDSIILRSISSLPKYIKEPFEKMKKTNYTIKNESNDAIITPPQSKDRPLLNKRLNESFERELAKLKDTMFLKNIDKNKIKSIYFGINYPLKKQQEIMKLVQDKKNGLGHVSLYKSTLSNERFELIQKKILL
ncbi:DUF2971 domain-containing protein [Aeromonas enterica]